MPANLSRMLNSLDNIGLNTNEIRVLELLIRRKESELYFLKTELIKKVHDEFHKAGIIANELPDLKSGSGLSFKEEELKELGSVTYLVKTAKTSNDDERAYYCGDVHLEFPGDRCGWVIGDPEERKCDETHHYLRGISEKKEMMFCCRVCGQPIGGLVLK